MVKSVQDGVRRDRSNDAERAKLGELGHRLGRKALGEVAIATLPAGPISHWHKNTPDLRHPQKLGSIAAISILGALHHQICQGLALD
jgi:hypothetical protein